MYRTSVESYKKKIEHARISAEMMYYSKWLGFCWMYRGYYIQDIQLRRENGDYFFVKYVGSIEGIDLDAKDEEGKEIYARYITLEWRN